MRRQGLSRHLRPWLFEAQGAIDGKHRWWAGDERVTCKGSAAISFTKAARDIAEEEEKTRFMAMRAFQQQRCEQSAEILCLWRLAAE